MLLLYWFHRNSATSDNNTGCNALKIKRQVPAAGWCCECDDDIERPQQMSREDGVTRGDVFCSQHRAVCVTLPRHCVTWQHHMSRTCDTPWQGPSCCYLNTRPSPGPGISRQKYFICPITSTTQYWSPAYLKCYSAIVDETFQSNIVYQIESWIFDTLVRRNPLWNCSIRKVRDI